MAAITITTDAGRRMGPTTHLRLVAVAGGNGRRSSRAKFWRRRLAVLCLAIGLVLVMAQAGVALGGSSLAAPERRPTVVHAGSLRTVVVRAGDSLWSIARRLAPGRDPRPVVDALQQARRGAPLMPGETVEWGG